MEKAEIKITHKKRQIKMLHIRNTILKMKKFLDGFINGLNIAGEEISIL